MANTIQPSTAYSNDEVAVPPTTTQPYGYKPPPPPAPGCRGNSRNVNKNCGVDDSGVNYAIPFPPTNLEAVAEEGQVTLSWDRVRPVSAGQPCENTPSYRVYRGTESGEHELLASSVDSTYVDVDVVGGTTYYYVVTAFNPAGESVVSAEVTATPPLLTTLMTDILSHWALNDVQPPSPDSLGVNDLLFEQSGGPSPGLQFGDNLGQSAGFNISGSQNGADLETNSNLVGGPFGSFTLAIWVNSAFFDTARPVMQNSNGGDQGFYLGTGWNGSVILAGEHNLPSAVTFKVASHVSSGPDLITDDWNLLVARYDDVTKDISITIVNANGTFKTTKPGAENPGGYTYEDGTWLSIGNNGLYLGGPSYRGYAIAATIWNRVVSDAGVANLYNDGDGLAFEDYGTVAG